MAIVASLSHRRGRVGIPSIVACVVRMNESDHPTTADELAAQHAEHTARQERLRDYAMSAAIGRPLFGR